MPLYQDIAEQLANQIRNGQFFTGDKLPSVRSMATQLKVSISTILEAYALLEQMELVQAKPQSGYYIRQRQRLLSSPPESKNLRPAQLRLGSTINEVLRQSRNDNNIQLGLAIPNAQLIPQTALDRATRSVLREQANRDKALMPPGSNELRKLICHRMMLAGCFVDQDQLVVTNGCQEALLLALQMTTNAGDSVAVESPCYHGFLLTLESLGLKVIHIATDPETGMDLDALELAASQWEISACICTPNFSNPTGACMSDTNKEKLVSIAHNYNFSLIEDDINGELSFDPQRPKALLAFDKSQRVIYCSSFSKSLSPQLRIGWLITGNRQQQAIERQMATTTGAPPLSQLSLAQYLKSGHFDKHLKKNRAIYQRNQQLALETIAQNFPDETTATQPEGGFLLWLALPAPINSFELYQQALSESISIVPGRLFGRSGFDNYLRINYAHPWTKKMQQTLARIGELATIQSNGQ